MTMLKTTELQEAEERILRELPRLLEQDPRFVLFIEGIVSEKFPSRDEFARLVNEFIAFRNEMNANFARIDQRLDRMDQRIDGLTHEMRDLRDWVELIAGRLQTRAGRNFENIIAGALRLGLQRPDIAPEHIQLRQKIYDPEGLVYKAGKQKEVDLVVQNGELLVFEVKSSPDVDDVNDFADKVSLVRLQNPTKTVRGVFVAVGSEADVRQRCAELGLILIPQTGGVGNA